MSGPQGPIEPARHAERPIDEAIRIGHVHLRTADIDRTRDFYSGLLGFDVVFEVRDVPGWGTTGDMLFVSAGGYHHHLGFNIWNGRGAGPPPEHSAGLRHWTVTLPTADDVAAVRGRVAAAGYEAEPFEGGFLVRDPWRTAVAIVAS